MKILISILLITNYSLLNIYCQWQPDFRLTNDPAISVTSQNTEWCIASIGDVVHVAWADGRQNPPGNYEIFYKRSTDGGLNWGLDKRLTNFSNLTWFPSIAVSGSIVQIVWYKGWIRQEIYYIHSTDSGLNWGTITQLTNDTASSLYPSLAVSGLFTHVVWEDKRDWSSEIYYKRSIDGGFSWGTDTRLSTKSVYAHSYRPSIAVSGSYVHVVWQDTRDAPPWNYETYYKRSTDGGSSWGTDTRLTNDSGYSGMPSIAVSGSYVHVVWFGGYYGYPEIYYKHSTDGGTSWLADMQITNNPASSYIPSCAANGSNVHIVWADNRDGNYEIYYKFSSDNGFNWATDSRLTINSAYSYNPSVSVSGSFVHAVWNDDRDGNSEIYYKRNPTGNPVSITSISSEIPKEYILSQNYPNPFNPTTKIKFAVPPSPYGEGKTALAVGVRLFIYDILGREIQTLVNEDLQPDIYEAEFDGSNYPSGLYYYKLTSGDYSETKKMILLR